MSCWERRRDICTYFVRCGGNGNSRRLLYFRRPRAIWVNRKLSAAVIDFALGSLSVPFLSLLRDSTTDGVTRMDRDVISWTLRWSDSRNFVRLPWDGTCESGCISSFFGRGPIRRLSIARELPTRLRNNVSLGLGARPWSMGFLCGASPGMGGNTFAVSPLFIVRGNRSPNASLAPHASFAIARKFH